jgi:hypothetical protein
MARHPRRSPDPWRRSLEESLPPRRDASRHVARRELVLITLVILAVLAMGIWFLFLAAGGPGPGTV